MRDQQARYAVLVRAHFEHEKLEAMCDLLAASDRYDLYLAANCTAGPVSAAACPTVPFKVSDLPALGFETEEPRFIVDISDVLFAHIKRCIPDYDFYILLEYDVELTRDDPQVFEALVERLSHPDFADVDMVGTRVREQVGEAWNHTAKARARYDQVWSTFFPIVGLSSRAIDHLHRERLDETERTAGADERIFCEAFVGSALLHAGFRICDLLEIIPDAYTDDSFYFGQPMLWRTPASRDRRTAVNHPVFDGREYLEKHLTYARHSETLLQYEAALDALDLPIAPELRSEFSRRANGLRGEGANKPPAPDSWPGLLAETPVILLPDRPGPLQARGSYILEPIGPEPVMAHVLARLCASGAREFIICSAQERPNLHAFLHERAGRTDAVTVELPLAQIRSHRISGKAFGCEGDVRVRLLQAPLDTTGDLVRRAFGMLQARRSLVVYGNALADVSLPDLFERHKNGGKPVTTLAAHRSGLVLTLAGHFERSRAEGDYLGGFKLNGGFTLLEPAAFDLLEPGESFEDQLGRLAFFGHLGAYDHWGFWEPADCEQALGVLRAIWDRGEAPWAVAAAKASAS